jgi:pimeloyl-ACP methyl ester carboxylesterase
MSTVEVNGITLNYETAGTGDPLLLVMGLGGSLRGWGNQVPMLSQYFQVITFDNRGVGSSSAPEDISTYSMSQFAADAVALLDHLGIERAHVFGVSMGGMIAQHIALDYPERVRGLVLGCTIPHYEPNPEPGDERAAEPWVLELMLAGISKSPEDSIRDSVKFNFAPDFAATHPAVIEEYIAEGVRERTPLHGFMGQWNAIVNHSTLERLHMLAAPTLIQHGDADKLVPIFNGRLLAQHIPNARFQLIPGAGHVYFLEQPELVNESVREFLQSI